MRFVEKVKNRLKRLLVYCAKQLGIYKLLKHAQLGFQLYIYERVRIWTDDTSQKHYRIYLFGKLLQRSQSNSPINERLITEKPVFYLKVNKQAHYTMMCIKHWLNVIYEGGGDFYIICDNMQLERQIIKTLHFTDANIKFITSSRRALRPIAKNLWTGYWEMATYAHLTPFYHAQENGIRHCWMIDADDTMFCLGANRIVEILRQAEKMAEQMSIDAFSLDMWRSRSRGQHWSLGILYITAPAKFCRQFEVPKNLDWTKSYDYLADIFNLDFFFNFIKDNGILRIETFYAENCYFIHWGELFRDPIASSICFWHDGKVFFPILGEIYKTKDLGAIDIADCWKISIDAELSESLKFMEDEVSYLHYCSPKTRLLMALGNFGSQSRHTFP